jgi:parvulin-like peptidyl-prolyl isomerase
MRSFHVVTLAPGGIGLPQIEQALFEEGQPEITGPIELGGAWVLVERLAFEPSRRLDSDEIRSDLTDRIRRGEASLAVANWLEERKRERGVLIDEDALSQLAPGT